MPAATAIEDVITGFIHQEILGRSDTEINPEDNLFTSGLVDSVGIMRLIAHLEACFEIKIPPADLIPQNFRTIRIMAAYLAGVLPSQT